MSSRLKVFSEEKKATLLEKIQKDLPDNWIAQFSKKHESRVYFFNKADGTRTWEHPGLSLESKKVRPKRKSDETLTKSDSLNIGRERADEPKKRKSNEKIELIKTEKNSELSTCATSVSKRKKKRKKKKSQSSSDQANSSFNNSFGSEQSSCDKDSFKTVKLKEHCTSTSSRNNICNQIQSSNVTASTKDVEMTEIDLTPVQEPDSTSHINTNLIDQQENDKERLILIIDTNVLLHKNYQSDLAKLVQLKRCKNNNFIDLECIIPWVVLQELDHLKQKKLLARSAISFLNKHFQVRESAIRGQTIFEAATVIDSLTVENNDDRILQCCFLMKQVSESNLPMLWTLDKNLMNKALVNNIKCCKDIADVLLMITKPENKTECHSTSFESHPEIPKPVNLDKNNNALQKNSPQKISVLSYEDLRSIYEQSIVHIKSSLAYILEKAMRDAFDELWLDIVFRKPPWSLKDILYCIRKHWSAVFKLMGVDHIIKVHVDRLLELQNSFTREMAEDINFITKCNASGLGLISGIDQRGKYGDPVKDDVNILRALHRSLKTGKMIELKDESEGDIHKSQQQLLDEVNVEMALVEETDFSDFWMALDKIWTSIISHCGMIFQSLSFVPTRINDAPEVCQALSATFETIPEKNSAAQALPLVIDLVQSLLVSLQKVFTSPNWNLESVSSFDDLLQTLWTTIQAFSIDCNIHRLFSLHRELCNILYCIRKHWSAVFKLMGVDHIIKVHVDRLLELQNSFTREMAEDINFITKCNASGLGLISGIDQRGKYGDPVKDDVNILRALHRSLKTGKMIELKDESEGDIHKSQQQLLDEVNVEMALVEETDFSDFWMALDKIWTSIISHCGMIFQSLSFVPTRINDAPEVCQALSATFETIPEKNSAAQALPLVIDLVQSLLVSLQKVFTSPNWNLESVSSFDDLLQTLWTTIQAFSIDCNIHRLFSLHRELCSNVVSSDNTMNRLKAGSRQLEVVKDLLNECLLALTSNTHAVFC